MHLSVSRLCFLLGVVGGRGEQVDAIFSMLAINGYECIYVVCAYLYIFLPYLYKHSSRRVRSGAIFTQESRARLQSGR